MRGTEVLFRKDGGTGWVDLPLSKSMAARVMVCEALGGREVPLSRLPDCNDSREMHRALAVVAGRCPDFKRVDCGEGAATLRFFVAAAAATEGLQVEVDCAEGLRRRPLNVLLDALRTLGAEIEGDVCPLKIRGKRLRGGELTLDSSVSSQYASALMMIAPKMSGPLRIRFVGEGVVSYPYLEMTAGVMSRYGIEAGLSAAGLTVGGGDYCHPVSMDIEPDWSAAAFLYEYALIGGSGSEVRIRRLADPEVSLQGDAVCARLFAAVGVETVCSQDGSSTLVCGRLPDAPEPLRLNLGGTPDLVPSIVVGLCMSGITFEIRGVGHLKYKECDRIDALQRGMRVLGYHIICKGEVIEWCGERCEAEPEVVIDVCGDHRMAMAFAPAAVRTGSVRISDPEVVGKSFPNFWREIRKVGIELAGCRHASK